MVMKTMRNLFVVGVIALAASVFSACGGGSGSGAGSNVPTDGLLGEIPSVAAKYLPEINELQEKRWHSSSNENREEIAKKEDALKAKWNEAIKGIQSVEGNEIPLEVSEGIDIRPESNFKITKVTITDDDVSVKAESSLILTAAIKCTDFNHYCYVAFDSEGNALSVSCGNVWSGKDQDVDWKANTYKEGAQSKTMFYTSTPKGNIWKNPVGWARLAKVVIMDSDSEAYKQAEEHVKANKDAFKNKDKEE